MAFSMNNSSGVPGSHAQKQSGDQLQDIAVESLSFKTFVGDTKVRLLKTSWPADNLPTSTSSLFSISSKRGLVAAAGPNSLIVSETKHVRDAFDSVVKDEQGNTVKVENGVKPFDWNTLSINIDVPRLSQVAFTSDGAHLIICAQDGGGLAVFDTQTIQNKQFAFQIGTENTAVRSLAPNPEFAHLVAVVLNNGNLMIANLQEKRFINGGNNSTVIKEGVSCVSWSVRGKQLIAGLGDGNAFQLDTSGAPKAIIPQPPDVDPDHHVSSVVWLSNDEFLLVHTPNRPQDESSPPISMFNYVHTDKTRSQFLYRKVEDPAGSWGFNRVPPIHYFSRLRKWHHMDDMLIVSSVCGEDIGLLTKSDVPLTSDNPVTEMYTNTSFANDSSKPSLPLPVPVDGHMSESTSTSPIGMALDLSSTDKVFKPINGDDEIDDSPFPLPALMVLNNEGILSAWWIVVNDAIRENVIFPDLVVAQSNATAPQAAPQIQASPFTASASAQPSPFMQAAPSAFAKPATPAFGQSPFGGASTLGSKPSVWGSANTTTTPGAAFGQPAFGQAGFGKPAFGSPTSASPSSGGGGFGSVGGLGQKQSPWGAPPATTSFASKTAQPFGAGASTASPFAKLASPGTASPFSAASGQSPFALQATSGQPAFASSAVTSAPTPGTSFGMSTQASFGSTITIDSSTGSIFGQQKSAFGAPSQETPVSGQKSLTAPQSQETDMMDDDGKEPAKKDAPGSFGLGPAGFQLGSTFKPDNTSKDESDEDEPPKAAPKKGLFGADFGAAVLDVAKSSHSKSPPIKEEPEDEPPSIFGLPAKKDEPRRSIFGSTPPSDTPTSTLFGKPTSATPQNPFSFGKPSPAPKDQPEPPQVTSKPEASPATGPSSTSQPSDDSQRSDEGDLSSLAGSPAEAVDMPESEPEDDSDESGEVEDDAPLPPDPTSALHKQTVAKASFFKEDPPGASAQQSPASKQLMPPPQAPTPQSKVSSLFSPPKPTTTTPAGFPTGPVFPPPKPALQDSPRSPSPVRSVSTPVGKPLLGGPISRPSSRNAVAKPLVRPSQPAMRSPDIKQEPDLEPEPELTAEDLTDDEDERIQQQLSAPPEPTLHLDSFVAHQDYTGRSKKVGIGAQIERVYRDGNSMIDTLGRNARTIANFIAGHTDLAKSDGRSKEDLEYEEEDDDWCLVEIEDLATIESEMEKELTENQLTSKDEKLDLLKGMRKDLVKTRQKLMEINSFLEKSKQPEKKLKIKQAPLDPEHARLQREIRTKYSEFQKSLVEAEESVTLLRTRLASATNGSISSGRVPTVEAVEKTIKRMTAMAEEKSGDIDVLERQMRKLGIAPDSRPGSSSMSSSKMMTSLRSSAVFTPSPRRNGPPSTPASKGRTFGLFDDSEDNEGSDAGCMEDARVMKFLEKRHTRNQLLDSIRDVVRERGVKVIDAGGF